MVWTDPFCSEYSKTCVKRPLTKRQKTCIQDRLSLNAGQKFAECSKGSILQFVRPSLSCYLSLRSFLSIYEWPFYSGLKYK